MPLEPLVGGEPARLILNTIRAFPLTVRSGEVIMLDTSVGEARAAFDRAYEIVELLVMADLAHCSEGHVHRTLDEHEFRHMVVSEMVYLAKKALGESGVPDPVWEGRI